MSTDRTETLKERLLRIAPRVLPYAVIAGVAVIVFHEFLLHGYVMDGQYDRRDNTLPYHLIFLRSLQDGVLPQWNPYLFCGNSLFSHSTYVGFYPFNWITWAFPEATFPLAMTFLQMGHFAGAGIFSWLLLREVVKDGFWALCGSIAYLLSSAAVMGLFTGIEQYATFVYFPAILYLILTSGRRRTTVAMALLTGTYALFLLGGQVQFVLYVLGFTVLFGVFAGLAGGEARPASYTWRPFALTVGSLFFALLIAAVRYVPFYYATQTHALVKQTYAEFIGLNMTPLSAVLKLFMSEVFLFLNKGEYFNSYTGIFPAFLALYGLASVWTRETAYWKLLVLLICLIVFGTPAAYLHYVLTGKGNLAFGRMAVLVPLGVSALAGFTGRMIMEDQRHIRRLLILSAILFGGILIWVGVLLLGPGPIFTYPQNVLEERAAMKVSLAILAVYFFLFCGMLIFLLRSRSPQKHGVFKTVFFLLMLAELLGFSHRDANCQNPAFVPPPLFRGTPADYAIAEESAARGLSFRIAGQSEGTTHNRSVHLGLLNSSGFESVPPQRIIELYGFPYSVPRDRARQIQPMNQRVMELTSTRYLVENDGVYEVPMPLPRYSLFFSYQVVNGDREALERLVSAVDFDMRKTVILDREPPLPIEQGDGNASVELVRQGMNDIAFRVVSPGNALLLLTDTYDEGWSATIDGGAAPVLRANYAFRAVAVPRGSHDVRLAFTHRGFAAGGVVSVIALLGYAVLAVLSAGKRGPARSGAVQGN